MVEGGCTRAQVVPPVHHPGYTRPLVHSAHARRYRQARRRAGRTALGSEVLYSLGRRAWKSGPGHSCQEGRRILRGEDRGVKDDSG